VKGKGKKIGRLENWKIKKLKDWKIGKLRAPLMVPSSKVSGLKGLTAHPYKAVILSVKLLSEIHAV
jgi:hypothetical protein